MDTPLLFKDLLTVSIVLSGLSSVMSGSVLFSMITCVAPMSCSKSNALSASFSGESVFDETDTCSGFTNGLFTVTMGNTLVFGIFP